MAQRGAEPQTEATEVARSETSARGNAERLAQLRSRVLLLMENRGKRSRRREGARKKPSANAPGRQAPAHRLHVVLGPEPGPHTRDEAALGETTRAEASRYREA